MPKHSTLPKELAKSDAELARTATQRWRDYSRQVALQDRFLGRISRDLKRAGVNVESAASTLLGASGKSARRTMAPPTPARIVHTKPFSIPDPTEVRVPPYSKDGTTIVIDTGCQTADAQAERQTGKASVSLLTNRRTPSSGLIHAYLTTMEIGPPVHAAVLTVSTVVPYRAVWQTWARFHEASARAYISLSLWAVNLGELIEDRSTIFDESTSWSGSGFRDSHQNLGLSVTHPIFPQYNYYAVVTISGFVQAAGWDHHAIGGSQAVANLSVRVPSITLVW